MGNSILDGSDSPLWNMNDWHPHLIIIHLGLNDFQNPPPYADTLQFDKTYQKLLRSLRQVHPGVQFILCASPIRPSQQLVPRVQNIARLERLAGHYDIQVLEYTTHNTAYAGHPNWDNHNSIAKKIFPLAQKTTGWLD